MCRNCRCTSDTGQKTVVNLRICIHISDKEWKIKKAEIVTHTGIKRSIFNYHNIITEANPGLIKIHITQQFTGVVFLQ